MRIMAGLSRGDAWPRRLAEGSINVHQETRAVISIKLDPRTAALVMIDLQKGILARSLSPRNAQEVVESASKLAARFRHAGGLVVWIRACWSPDFGDRLRQWVDRPMEIPAGGFPEDFATIAEGLAQPSDLIVTKRQWGAFYGTELDLQLRRRGVRTIVLGGVATNIGVESTARDAWERGYEVVLVEDATSSLSTEMHDFSIRNIMPRIAVVAPSAAVMFKED